MKPIGVILMVSLILSPLSAQQDKHPAREANESVPVFKGSTAYVQVPVVVQREGKHVTGLKKETFILREDGKEREIASFEEVHSGTVPAMSSDTASKSNVTDPIPSQITVIALDMVNTPAIDRSYFVEQLQRYLSRARRFPGPIGVVAIERSGARLLREFTTNPAVIIDALKQVSTNATSANNDPSPLSRSIQNEYAKVLENDEVPPDVVQQALRMLKFAAADEAAYRFQDRSARIDMQLAIQQLAQALKGIPGRKSLLLVGSGFKFIDTKIVLNVIGNGRGGVSIDRTVENANETLDQAAYTWKLLNDANVAVYPIDTRRTVNTAFQNMDTSNQSSPSRFAYEQTRQADLDVLDSFRTLAAASGGKPCIYRTDLDNCVHEAVDDDHDYYLLGFYPDKSNRKPGWRKIEVKLKNQKANVRYRQGFMLANFNPEAQRRTDISLALSSPFAYTDLKIRAKFDDPGPDKEGKKAVSFHIMIPPGGIVPADEQGQVNFDIVVIARTEGGKVAGDFSQHVDRRFPEPAIEEIKTTGIDYKNTFDLAPGDYAVWFVVRDNVSGRTGSSVVRLKVP